MHLLLFFPSLEKYHRLNIQKTPREDGKQCENKNQNEKLSCCRLGELPVSWQMEKQQFAAVVVVVPGTRKRSFAGVIHNKMRENEFFFLFRTSRK